MMRFKEINSNNIGPQQQQGDNPEQTTTEPQKSVPVNAPVYADKKQSDQLYKELQSQLPDIKIQSNNAKGSKLLPHIRVWGISPATLKQTMSSLGATLKTADRKQSSASSSFPTFSFEKEGVLYSVVISMKTGKKTDDESYAGIAGKELTPTGLGISGKTYNKEQLILVTKKSVESKFRSRDPILADALITLVDSAASGGNTPLAAQQMEHIQPILGTVSYDFGEILAPLLIMDDADKVEFPPGAYPLIDVKLPKFNLSVKALTGSGTSFRTIADLMDKYEASISQDPDAQSKFSILKSFHPKSGGKNVDKIIAAAAAAQVPEYREALQSFGRFNNFKELASRMKTFGWKKESKDDYKDFLTKSVAVFKAAGTEKYVGMPADGFYYLGIKNKEAKEKAAGFPSFSANPSEAAANIITYSLGVGLLNYVKKGPDSDKYKKMMTDIVNKSEAVLGHISINNDGTLKLSTKPFSELNFEFQYHAPSHMPGNNLPGFIAIL